MAGLICHVKRLGQQSACFSHQGGGLGDIATRSRDLAQDFTGRPAVAALVQKPVRLGLRIFEPTVAQRRVGFGEQ